MTSEGFCQEGAPWKWRGRVHPGWLERGEIWHSGPRAVRAALLEVDIYGLDKGLKKLFNFILGLFWWKFLREGSRCMSQKATCQEQAGE